MLQSADSVIENLNIGKQSGYNSLLSGSFFIFCKENKWQPERLFMHVYVTLSISIYQYFYIIYPSNYSFVLSALKQMNIENHYILKLKLFATMKLTFKDT